MGVVGFLVYLAIVVAVVVLAVKATYFAYKKITGNELDLDWFPDTLLIAVVIVVALFGSIFLNCQIGQFVASISDFEENAVTYEVKMAYFDDKQTSKSSSAQYIFWVDQNGELHDDDKASSVSYVDSDDWKFVKIEYKTIGWLKNQFYRKEAQKTMYIPYKELGYTK